MFEWGRKNRELEAILQELEMNASNNYKDNAQKNLRELEAAFARLSQEGKLNARQKESYGATIEGLRRKMKNYTHGDQKPDYRGCTGMNDRQ